MDIVIYDSSQYYARRGSAMKRRMDRGLDHVDSVVRESIQNSIDAWDRQSPSIHVDYLLGKFDCYTFNNEFSGISDALNERFKGTAQYLAIKDYGTTGLTGKISSLELQNDEDPGNLLKLVFHIERTKGANEDTGGSWGVGKTVYSNIGIGIVIYYSRIKTTNGFQSRLVAAIIEDETSEEAIVPPFNNQRSGLAWWGRKVNDRILPITDEAEIGRFLRILSIAPYNEDQVGTMVIIPYVETNLLSAEVRSRLGNSDAENPIDVDVIWLREGRFADYISKTVLRWYYPRLNNRYYKYNRLGTGFGPQLKVSVIDTSTDNVKPVDINTPLYQIMQALYNRAAWGDSLPDSYSDFITEHSEHFIFDNEDKRNNNYAIGDVRYKRKVDGLALLGRIAVAKIPMRMLDIPTNPEPRVFFNISNGNPNDPIIAFSRKIGMVVWYEDLKAKSSMTTNKDCYVLSQFVANSEDTLDNDADGLELKLRAAEGEDHHGWTDNHGSKVATKIKNESISFVYDAFINKSIIPQENDDLLGKLVGKEVLPKFTETKVKKKGKKRYLKVDEKSLSYKLNEIEYSPYTLHYTFTLKPDFEEFSMVVKVASETGAISQEEWDGIFPFEISRVSCKVQTLDDKRTECLHYSWDNEGNETYKLDMLYFDLIQDDVGFVCGVNVKKEQPLHDFPKMVISFSISLDLKDRRYNPSIEILVPNSK